MRKRYNMSKTISVKGFISELGENFSKHMKERLLELEVRCVLTRKEYNYRLDLKHVEHTKYDFECCAENKSCICKKEYAYGQFVVIDGILYFSQECAVNDNVIQSPIVSTIYNSLSSDDMISDSGISEKKIDDSNIDYVIDSILAVCPQVSQSYMDIMAKYII